uniref:Uncharacterized protein n=1 Tax=Romanomermis culicivorax TaxID=13658 RepID=A0A915K9Q1_ROMCU
MSRNCQFKRK